MAVQTLGIIDENVAETYRIKLISPKFQNPESLRNINVPQEAIDMLKFGELMKDDKRHLMQWILITHDNKVETFFPFLPPCNHFEDVYLPRSKEVAG